MRDFWKALSVRAKLDLPASGAGPKVSRRLIVLGAAFLAWAAIIIGRLIHLQVLKHAELLHLAELQQEKTVPVEAPRGAIHDRSGQTLAHSVPVDSVCVNPMRVPDMAVAADILSRVLDLDRAALLEGMTAASKAQKSRGFFWVKRKITPQEAERLRSLRLDWIEFRRESKRRYPKGALAAHVVGSVGHDEQGNAGVEMSLNRELRGAPGKMRVVRDVRLRTFSSEVIVPPQPGANLTLTIDERLQFFAERELKKAGAQYQERGGPQVTGRVVVMNPHTGDVLALASYPAFDPAQPVAPGGDLSARTNLAVSTPFEPGSCFKVITLATALETGKVRPDTSINCRGGVLMLAGRTVHEAKRGYGFLTVEEILAKSSNIGAILVGQRVGEEDMHRYMRLFGFGSPTGIPLPYESPGRVRDLKKWEKTSLASMSMGHEVSTTALQLAQACSVIANGGLLVRPRLVLRRQRPGGAAEEIPVRRPEQILQARTAFAMRMMMRTVVEHGTGGAARLKGYSAAGKTGSAQIYDYEARKYTHYYNASFMGFAPVAKPAVVVVATLNNVRKFGGVVAAPVFREVTTAALRLMEVPRDLPEKPAVPRAEPVDEDDVAIAEFASPGPPPENVAAATAEAVAEEPFEGPSWLGPTVPNFRGKTLRAVVEESQARGLPVVFSGSGIARAQAPQAGAVLPPGASIHVQFAR